MTIPALPTPDTTTLDLPPDLDFDAWTELAGTIFAAAEHSMWWVGDLLTYAEDHYATNVDGTEDTHGQARIRQVVALASTLDFAEIRSAREISRRYPPATRRQHLSWRHHAHLADTAVAPDLTDQLLDVAEREGWTVAELDAERRRWGATDTTATDATPEPTPVKAGIRITCPPGTDPAAITSAVQAAADQLASDLAGIDIDANIKTALP